jgi:2-succinyl-6-hydroxy-2,4-cyclohexadiene-1-carboxylate synthase
MLAYDLRGPGDGAPIAFLHGFSQRRWSWDEQVGALPAGWRALTVDLPGHGEDGHADAAAASMEAAASAVLAVWDALGWVRPHLVGYSLGGRLALHLAAHHPERVASLVALGSHAGMDDETAREARRQGDEELARRIEERGVAWFSRHWASLPLFAGLARRGPAFLAELDRMRRTNRPAGLAASLRGMGAAATTPFWHRLGAITVPVLLLAGDEDEKYVAAAHRLRRHLPHARLALVPAAGHTAHLEQPTAFAALLTAHLTAGSGR